MQQHEAREGYNFTFYPPLSLSSARKVYTYDGDELSVTNNLLPSSARYVFPFAVSPHWQVKPRPLYHVISRKNIVIDCQSEGIPAPTHQWKKVLTTVTSGAAGVGSTGTPNHMSSVSSLLNGDLVAIVSGPHMHVLENGSLSIVEASKSDEGDYVCEA